MCCVYILIIPGFGVISEVLCNLCLKELFGKKGMMNALTVIAILGFIVWGLLMFVVGLDCQSRAYFTTSTMIIAVPTAIKIFSWLTTIHAGKLSNLVSYLHSIAFIILFTIGGLSGIFLSNACLDILFLDNHYTIALFLYVLSMGAVFSIINSYYFYSIQILGRLHKPTLAKIQFWLLLIGVNYTFFPMLMLGFNGLPRRYSDYSELYNGWNYLISFGSYITLTSLILLLYIIADLIDNNSPILINPFIYKLLFFSFFVDINLLNNSCYIRNIIYSLSIPIYQLSFLNLPINLFISP